MSRSFPAGIVSVELSRSNLLNLLKAGLGLTKAGDFIIRDGDREMSFEKFTDILIGSILVIGKTNDGRIARIETKGEVGRVTITILDPDPETLDE